MQIQIPPSWYDIAQICLDGHVINECVKDKPERNEPFCPQCGAQTIKECQVCHAPIPGYYHVPGRTFLIGSFARPKFCSACGHAYPWTERALEAARELAGELEGLSDEDKTVLKESIDELVRDSQRTEVAAVRFKRLIAKARGQAVVALRQILIDIVSEVVKKKLLE